MFLQTQPLSLVAARSWSVHRVHFRWPERVRSLARRWRLLRNRNRQRAHRLARLNGEARGRHPVAESSDEAPGEEDTWLEPGQFHRVPPSSNR